MNQQPAEHAGPVTCEQRSPQPAGTAANENNETTTPPAAPGLVMITTDDAGVCTGDACSLPVKDD